MITVKYKDESRNVIKAAENATFKNQFHAAASIRKTAAASLIRVASDRPSSPGRPPHTHKGVFLRRAWRFNVDKEKKVAVIGPRASAVGDVGATHEYGEKRGNARYPRRPTALPALQSNIKRIANQWKGSIGG